MARFLAFFTLFHLSLTFFSTEVPFKGIACVYSHNDFITTGARKRTSDLQGFLFRPTENLVPSKMTLKLYETVKCLVSD